MVVVDEEYFGVANLQIGDELHLEGKMMVDHGEKLDGRAMKRIILDEAIIIIIELR